MKMKYLCLAIYLAWSGVVAAETVQQASAVSVVVAKSDDELREKEIELKAQEKSQAMMEKYLALHEKTITGQQKSVDWWIAAMGLILALAGYVQFKFMQSKQKEWEEECDKLRDEMKQELANAKNLTTSIQNHHDESQELIARMKKMSPSSPDKTLSDEQIAQNRAGIEAAEKLVDNREIPLIEQLRAQAILLSDNAEKSQQYHDYEKAFHAWYAVWLQDENDADVCFKLGWIAQSLYEHATRTQQLYWQPEIEKWYGKVLQIKPDVCDATYNWGLALSYEAQALQQENRLPEAYEKWQQAGQRYQQALQIKPDKHEAANNWGASLNDEAQALQQENRLPEAYEKWQQAGQRYQQALQIKPDFHEAANNWGASLNDEAQALQQENRLPEAYEKWQQAGQRYQQALQIKPDFHEAANNWMSGLLKMYQAIKVENPDMATQSLQQAKQIAHDFLAKYPQYAPYFAYNRACLSALENNLPQAIEQLKLSQQADDFPNKAHILQDKDLENIRETPEFQAWLKEAFPDTE
ncbi:TPR end-of-group domain-containing protein [Wielerella bovis]|uniref:TPR end-of-group domain-containing protein n=1 Tax=Wielerella bovis TaxID=2917790 RepID=UPI002018F5C3|nr:hypothetical protein [Wielerella bovis]ULJ65177.1 hypothetical protein MIS33_02500 [Wielerella bovis]ULJ67450.1 hypothetical protein MIS31_02505 [Wielerella bovis]